MNLMNNILTNVFQSKRYSILAHQPASTVPYLCRKAELHFSITDHEHTHICCKQDRFLPSECTVSRTPYKNDQNPTKTLQQNIEMKRLYDTGYTFTCIASEPRIDRLRFTCILTFSTVSSSSFTS